MRRFFFEAARKRGNLVELDTDESHHITKVLRLGEGAGVELFDGSGPLFAGRIHSVGRQVRVEITASLAVDKEPGPQVVVYQGLLKGEKMDLVVQKCTELGVSLLQPVQCLRCQGKLTAGQVEKKLVRWQRISLAACKQSMRLTPMNIGSVLDFWAAVGEPSGDRVLRLLFWEEEELFRLQEIGDWQLYDKVYLLLGPEGGLSAEEVAAASGAGWRTVSMGKCILRAETATLAAAAIVQHCVGHM